MTPQQLLTSDEIEAPDISHLVLEDDTPVDNFQSAKQQRLLIEPLYSSQVLPIPFIADANVGIFGSITEEGIAPDVFVSLGVQMPEDWSQRQNRSYLVWQFGKFPDVVIEIVSNRKGNELIAKESGKLSKQEAYARMGIGYYAIFDPLEQIQEAEQMNGALLKVFVLTGKRYVEMAAPFWLHEVGLGLTLWEGEFESKSGVWLRWCDQDGQIIPTGAEGRDLERQRADEAESKAQRLAERLRAMGVNPDEV